MQKKKKNGGAGESLGTAQGGVGGTSSAVRLSDMGSGASTHLVRPLTAPTFRFSAVRSLALIVWALGKGNYLFADLLDMLAVHLTRPGFL